MNDYSDVINGWNNLWNSYYYQDMPFFRVIIRFFCKNSIQEYITANEMKFLILHYKNALNEYKKMLLEIDLKQAPFQKRYFYLRKKIQLEYEKLLEIYDDLLNVEDMKNGKTKATKRAATKTDR